MTPPQPFNEARQNAYRMVGALDAAARIYSNAIVLPSYIPTIRERMREAYGGSIEGHRLVIRGRGPRMRLLNEWLTLTRDREQEIRAELHRLEHMHD